MIRKIVFVLLSFINYAWAQENLVPNHSFELNTGCYNNDGGINHVVNNWNTSYNSVDYYNPCNNSAPNPFYGVPANANGYQNAFDGIAYAGIFVFSPTSPSARDYLIVELIDSIIKGIPYIIKFYVSPADKVQYALTYKLGVYLTKVHPAFAPTNLFTQIPQALNKPENSLIDTSEWIMVVDTFTSNIGGENFISIGNFFDNESSDTISIGDGINFYSKGYYYVDDVWVTPLDTTIGIEEDKQITFSVYPNPAKDKLTIETDQLNKQNTFQLIDITGRVVLMLPLQGVKTTIDISRLSAGVYVGVLEENGRAVVRRKIVVE